MNSGWLLEMNNQLFMTDSAQKALSFTSMINTEVVSTSETNLGILLSEVQNLFIRINTDKNARVKELSQNIKKLKEEIKLIKSGKDVALSDSQKREKISTIYDMANRLPFDFRKLEEEIREVDIKIRQSIIKNKNTKGQILQDVLAKEREQRKTAYGEAFEGFFKLLCDDERQNRFKNQLDYLLKNNISQFLKNYQIEFLRDLTNILIKSCDRIHRIRSTIDKNLELYINSTDLDQNQNIAIILKRIEQIAIKLKDEKFSFANKKIKLELQSGKIKTFSPINSIELRRPSDRAQVDDYSHHTNSNEISKRIIQKLDTVKIRVVRNNVLKFFKDKEIASIASIINYNKIEYGLEEVIAYIRIANELKAERLEEIEELSIIDKKTNKILKIKIPKQIITKSLVQKYQKEFQYE